MIWDDRTSPDARLPIKIKRIPGGFTVDLADGRKLWIYGREPEVARAANAMTLAEAEQLAKDVARALTKQWGGAIVLLLPQS